MNITRPIVYSLASALLLSGCVAREHHRSHVHRTWAATAIHHVEVHEIAGAINVEATPSNTIELDADIDAYTAPNKHEEYFEASIEGDTLIIGRKHRRQRHFFFGHNEATVNYEIKVPATIALDLNTVNGRVSSRGVGGETEVTTVNGSISVDTPGTSEVSAHTVNGRIECRFAENFKGASFKTVNGRVLAVLPPSASFIGDFSQVNGDIEAAFPLNIHSHPGSRRVSGEVNGGEHELKIVTVNGDIKIENGGGPPLPKVPNAPNAIPAPPVAPGVPALPARPAPPAPPTA